MFRFKNTQQTIEQIGKVIRFSAEAFSTILINRFNIIYIIRNWILCSDCERTRYVKSKICPFVVVWASCQPLRRPVCEMPAIAGFRFVLDQRLALATGQAGFA